MTLLDLLGRRWMLLVLWELRAEPLGFRALQGVCNRMSSTVADLAALGERWRGAAQGVDDLAVLLAGDRIGAGVFESGRLLHGSRGGFGELGYVGPARGGQGLSGLAALARAWGGEAVRSAAPTSLSEMCHNSPDDLTAEMVFAAAADGDHVALKILDRLTTSMARVIASLSILLNPALVVIGGAVAESADAITPDLTARLSTYTSTPPLVAVSRLATLSSRSEPSGTL
ncbi:ROK family protein [Streptomyces sp. NPDC001816]|uniref:ROK family protein n=1 Tax=Streptomyces sp. NPDC001816 TaxID=3364612 RepID=UPI0036749424